MSLSLRRYRRASFASPLCIVALVTGVLWLWACGAAPREDSLPPRVQTAWPYAESVVPSSAPSTAGALTAGAPTASAAAEPPVTVTFLSVGDILLSRLVAKAIAEADDPELPFRPMAEVFRFVDFSFGNLESPFSDSDWFSEGPAHIFNTPRANVRGLVAHGFRIVNLANNHALDQGVRGLHCTLDHLTAHGIQHVGAGRNREEAWAPAFVQAKDITIAFVGASYASVNDSGRIRNSYVARIDDQRRLLAALTAARAGANFVVVTMHAGPEYHPKHGPAQTHFARLAIDHGADIVIGAHPHVIQGIEIYRDRYILYSLGNFIFDHIKPLTTEGLAVISQLRLPPVPVGEAVPAGEAAGLPRAKLVRLELLPVVIEGRSTPRLADEREAAEILGRIDVTDPVLVP